MKIIVTGGAGFLGKHLCRALAKEGHQLKVVDLKPNPEFETVQADVRDLALMKQVITDADAVFHLAALIEAGESVKQPQQYVDYNITGTVSVMEAMRENGIHTFAFSSSAAIYGEPEKTPIVEDDRTLPINPYGMTKLAMEGLVRSYVESHGFTGIALRYFNLYGPEEHHQPETHAIPRFIKQVHEGSEVTVWGDGSHQRDFIFIDDVVSAHLGALKMSQQRPNEYHYYNLSTQQPTRVIDVIYMIEELMGKPALIKNFPPRPGDPMILTASAEKAIKELGWHPQVEIREGLQRTIEYFIKQWQNN